MGLNFQCANSIITSHWSMRVICGDGSEVRVPKRCFGELRLFKNPSVISTGSYTLKCKASPQIVNMLLDHVDDESEATITDDNFQELQGLCRELEFSGLDAELSEFASRFKERRTIEKPALPPPMRQVKTFDFAPTKGFNGIFAYMTRKAGGNIADKGVIHIMGSGVNCRDIVDFGGDQRYVSSYGYESGERWICFDFKKWRVIPTRYTVKSDIGDSEYGLHLRSWTVDVSNDGYTWTEIDRHVNNDSLNDEYASVNFICANPPRESVRFFRLTQIANTDDEGFAINSLEIFGTLFVTEKTEQPEPQEREIAYQEDREGQSPPPLFPPKFDGIIAHLTLQFGGNLYDRRFVYVMGESIQQRELVDLTSDDCCWVNDYIKEPWICYDFIRRRVMPTSYSIRLHGSSQLKSWVIDVSNDGYTWTEIDRRVNNNDLKDRCGSAKFNIARAPREGFRFFRLRQIGEDPSGFKYLYLEALEIFGTLLLMEKIKEPEPREQEFAYQADKEGLSPPPLFPPKLDGVIAHLTRRYGGKVHDRGIINVSGSASSYTAPIDGPKWAAELVTLYSYCSVNEKNAWISYDFKTRRVIPKSYSIRADSSCAPRSWVIEVSNNEDSWKIIDRREKNSDLNWYSMAHFKIAHVPTKAFRFIRLRQTGRNQDDRPNSRYQLSMVALEIFGTLYKKSKSQTKPPK